VRTYAGCSLPVLLVLFATCSASATAQQSPNTNPTYHQLRSLAPAGDAIAVKNLVLQRGDATFTLQTGSVQFYPAVNGKVTGAVFLGQGHFHLTPPSPEEQHNLKILTHSESFDEDFTQLVLRFTDSTAVELRKSSAGPSSSATGFAHAASELTSFQRDTLLHNIDLRLLEDVLSPAPGGYFLAAIRGDKDHHLLFTVDPHGASGVEPEQVSLMNWNTWGPMYLTAFNPPGSTTPAAAGQEAFHADQETLDTTIQKNGFLTGIATVHLIADQNGVAVAPLELFPTLRVSRVVTDSGQPLDFVQEDKDHDADFGAILSKPLAQGQSATLRIEYAGRNVVQNEGGANYYPVARQSWYPNAGSSLGDYTTYQMTFHVPKGLELIATGTKVSDKTDGKVTTTVWKTDVPLPVVGFNLGQFTEKSAELKSKSGNTLTVDAYANTNPPDALSHLTDVNLGDIPDASLGNFDAPKMLPVELSQAEIAAQLYTSYYGFIPFSHIAVTQQFACNYGQSWPMLVFLPICGFLDQTQQHFLGLQPEDMYWKTVTPHEVAHQWWGQTVGFRSYRDQWMSEGFADASAALFLEATRPKPDDYLDFWKQQQQLLTQKNEAGFRPIDVGPVTMGFRLSTSKTGWSVYQNLVYPKGAFILHMIRMMMWSPQQGDKPYVDMMHDFVNTYRLKVATTEDFKAMVEKHMTRQMDLEGTHTMDWFFREYVYGTDLPVYHFEGQATPDENGWKLHILLTQSGVGPDFVNAVPVYLRLANGKVMRLGSFRITGARTEEQNLQLPKFPSDIKQVLINYNYDVLCAYD